VSLQFPKVGQLVKASRDIHLNIRNVDFTILSSAGPALLPKDTEAEVTAVTPQYIEVNCKTGGVPGLHAWGLKIRVARHAWGTSFA
jgi:hypothetical protein